MNHKSLLEDLISRLDEERRYEFEERAGIIEFDAGQSRDQAELLALVDLLREHPGALTGLTALKVQHMGVPAFVFTADVDLARERLPGLGVTVIDTVDPVETLNRYFGGSALLVSLG